MFIILQIVKKKKMKIPSLIDHVERCRYGGRDLPIMIYNHCTSEYTTELGAGSIIRLFGNSKNKPIFMRIRLLGDCCKSDTCIAMEDCVNVIS